VPSATVSSGERCDDEIPFEPTYLPAGFDRNPKPGPAPGGRPYDDRDQVILHFRGEKAHAIEVRRPGTLFTELALGDDAPTIRVLGHDTASFGPISPHGHDFMVFITHPNRAEPGEQCATFSLNGVGVSLGELKRVAEELREVE
jgi:hypothetical protein